MAVVLLHVASVPLGTDLDIGTGSDGRSGQAASKLMNSRDNDVRDSFPLVCLGGATTDLDGFIQIIRNLPVDLPAAIIVINLMRGMGTALVEALIRCTKLPVEMVAERLPVQSNRVFVLQEGWDLHLTDGEFRLKPVSKPTGSTNVVTTFQYSLAKNWHGPLVAVILTGLDGNGAAALCEIKKAGGTTIAQRVQSGRFPDMPSAAIASGYIDLILPVRDISKEIVRIANASKQEMWP